jgi:hypothetical protein
MSLRVVDIDGGGSGPVIFCDACQERIEDADGRHATAAWVHDEQNPGGAHVGPVYYAHQGRCFMALEGAIPGTWMTVDLDVFLFQLTHNVKYDRDSAAAGQGLLDTFRV